MSKEVLAEKHGIALAVLFLMGSTVIFGVASRSAPDSWLAVAISVVLAIPLVLVYARLRVIYPNKDIFQTMQSVVGTWPARALLLLYALYAWRLSFLVMKNFAEFMRIVVLEETPRAVIKLLLAVFCIWAAKAGVEVLGRWSAFFLRVVLVLSGLAIVLVIGEMDFSNFQPILYHGWEPVLTDAIGLLEFPFLEAIVLLFAFDEFRRQNGQYRVFFWGIFSAGIILLIGSSVTLAVIGPDSYQVTYFPVQIAVSRINIEGFLTRLEILVGFIFLLGSFVKITACLIGACKASAWVLGFKDYRFLVTPLGLAMVPGSLWIIPGAIEMIARIEEPWPPFEFLMQLIIPITLWIIAELKVRLKGAQK